MAFLELHSKALGCGDLGIRRKAGHRIYGLVVSGRMVVVRLSSHRPLPFLLN